jgi:hypothetical protein
MIVCIGGIEMKVLKTALWFGAIYCLVESICVFLPWWAITAYFDFYGFQVPAAEPINVFMIRLLSALFGMIGIFFIILSQNPLKYGAMLLLAAYGLLCLGVFYFLYGILYGLPISIYADIIYVVAAGILILIFRKRALRNSNA